MTIITLLIIILAGLVHSSFQLSVSVLTLISSHALGSKYSHSKLLNLTSSFVFGVGLMTALLLSTLAFISLAIFDQLSPESGWIISCSLMIAISICVLLFYYRKRAGTELWLPRSMASYLHKRIKLIRLPAEAFTLGLVSVITEIIFIIAPLFTAAYLLIQIEPEWQLFGVSLYVIVACLPMIIIWRLISHRVSLSSIQRWRENNKRFLQIIAGLGLLILSLVIYVFYIMEASHELIS